MNRASLREGIRRLGPRRMRSRARRAGRDREGDHARLERQLVWMFGSPRSGSTWLLSLLGLAPGAIRVNEPGIGVHLGLLLTEAAGPQALDPSMEDMLLRDVRREDRDYFFSDRYAGSWRPGLRRMVLDRLQAQHGTPLLEERRVAIIKEPNGSQAADMILSSLPGSRLIFLLRDGRDVIDSHLDLLERGTWGGMGAQEVARSDRPGLLVGRARVWLRRTEAVQRAYQSLPPERRVMVRYEELLADTTGVLRRLFDWLGLEISDAKLQAGAAELAYDSLPEEVRGPGRFARAATPGLWRENLSPEEQRLVEGLIGPKLEELGYETETTAARRR